MFKLLLFRTSRLTYCTRPRCANALASALERYPSADVENLLADLPSTFQP